MATGQVQMAHVQHKIMPFHPVLTSLCGLLKQVIKMKLSILLLIDNWLIPFLAATEKSSWMLHTRRDLQSKLFWRRKSQRSHGKVIIFI